MIATEETKKAYCAPVVLSMGERSDEEGIARHLFDILRRFDETDVDVIYSESFETPNLGTGDYEPSAEGGGTSDDKGIGEGYGRDKKDHFCFGQRTSRAAMAAGSRSLPEAADFSVEARGLLVQFPEPLNQKAEAVMISNGIVWERFLLPAAGGIGL